MSAKPAKRSGTAAQGAGHGGPARGYSWPPFEPGNQVALRHGAYAMLTLRPRATEIAERLTEMMGERFDPKYTAVIEAGALAAARVERALGHLLSLDESQHELASTLDGNARSWLRLYIDTLERLGLTPEHGTPAVNVQLTAVTIEQDAATQARLFAKLRQAGLVCGRDVVEGEARALPEPTSGGGRPPEAVDGTIPGLRADSERNP
jgi:hypothetical protein